MATLPSAAVSQPYYEATAAGKWLVAASVMLGTFLSVMDATVVNVAMPHMMGSFGEDLLTITWTGIALLTVGLTAAQIVLERGEEVDWFASNWIIIGTVMGAVGIIALLIWELMRAEPIIDFRLFKNRLLSVGCAIGSAAGFALSRGRYPDSPIRRASLFPVNDY